MKDVTSTSFGLVIAFLLPGLAMLYAMEPYFPALTTLFGAFSTAPSTLGVFFVVVLLALALGLQITALRWIVYELVLCFRWRIKTELFQNLPEEQKLTAFRAAVDEHYRYHQYWGGISLVLPFFFPKLQAGLAAMTFPSCLEWPVFLTLEGITVAAALTSYRRYTARGSKILAGK